MDTFQTLMVVTMLAILAEVTYLVTRLPRQSIGKKQGRAILIDTSVLIDGRILAVASSGFVTDTLVIPRSVIGELQFLADNADHDKRARARHGLDVVTELQGMPEVIVEILQDGSKAEEGVDERLLKLAKQHGAAVCTIDYNLNKVAVVEGITVLNVNELAQSLRMAYLPGEKMLLELVQKGQDSHQGVGYLPDGTMVVVEHANKYIGQTVEIEFIRSLQTAAGKMMFAKRAETKQQAAQKVNNKPSGKKPQAPKEKVEKLPTQQPQQKPAQTVYHSDEREQKRVAKPPTNKPQKQARETKAHVAEVKQQSQAPKQQPKQQKPRRPKTSAEREAALIDLVENMK